MCIYENPIPLFGGLGRIKLMLSMKIEVTGNVERFGEGRGDTVKTKIETMSSEEGGFF